MKFAISSHWFFHYCDKGPHGSSFRGEGFPSLLQFWGCSLSVTVWKELSAISVRSDGACDIREKEGASHKSENLPPRNPVPPTSFCITKVLQLP